MIKWIYKFSDKEHGSGTGTKYPKPKTGFLWIRCFEPTEAEIKKLKEDFGIRRTTRYTRETRSVKYSFMPLSFTFVDYYMGPDKQVQKENVLFWVEKNVLITLAQKRVLPYETCFDKVKENLACYPSDLAYLFYDMVEDDAEENFDVLEVTESRIMVLEKQVLDPKRSQDAIIDVLKLKRELSFMVKILWGSARILYMIRKGMTPFKLNENMIRLIDDVHDTLIHQVNVVTSQREMLTDLLTIYQTTITNRLASISNRINTSVKLLTTVMLWLTGITLVLTFPNTLATMFGVPELRLPWYDILLLLFLVSVIPLLWFIRFWTKTMRLAKEAEKKANGL